VQDTAGRCQECGQLLPPALDRGRPRRYCSVTCRSAARRARQRTEELSALNSAHRCSASMGGLFCDRDVEFVLCVDGRESRLCAKCHDVSLLYLIDHGVAATLVDTRRVANPSAGTTAVPAERTQLKANRSKIILVEDDLGIAQPLCRALVREGYSVSIVGDGPSGLRQAYVQRPDLILLDLGLPGLDGLEVLRRLRAVSDVPVIVLTARTDEVDVIVGLTAGADDYVCKPFRLAELMARIERAVQRYRSTRRWTKHVYDDGLLRLDSLQREACVAGVPVSLTTTEFRLLDLLVRHPGMVQPLDKILARVWDDTVGNGSSARVKFAVSRLRRKLDLTAMGSAPIVSARGLGYFFRPPAVPAAVDKKSPQPASYGHADNVLNILNARDRTS